MVKVLAFDRPKPGVTMEDIQPHLREEAKHAWALYKAGVYREIYLRTDRPGAVLILECADVEAAKMLTDDLPLVKAGLIEFEFMPLGPFMAWETLFTDDVV